MAITITIEQSNTVIEQVDGVLYKVLYKIIASEGIPLALFTFKVDPDEYSHPSTVYDIDAYPESRAEAYNLGLDFYRTSEVVRQFEYITDAIQFISVVQSRLNSLISALPLVQSSFITHEIYTLPLS